MLEEVDWNNSGAAAFWDGKHMMVLPMRQRYSRDRDKCWPIGDPYNPQNPHKDFCDRLDPTRLARDLAVGRIEVVTEVDLSELGIERARAAAVIGTAIRAELDALAKGEYPPSSRRIRCAVLAPGDCAPGEESLIGQYGVMMDEDSSKADGPLVVAFSAAVATTDRQVRAYRYALGKRSDDVISSHGAYIDLPGKRQQTLMPYGCGNILQFMNSRFQPDGHVDSKKTNCVFAQAAVSFTAKGKQFTRHMLFAVQNRVIDGQVTLDYGPAYILGEADLYPILPAEFRVKKEEPEAAAQESKAITPRPTPAEADEWVPVASMSRVPDDGTSQPAAALLPSSAAAAFEEFFRSDEFRRLSETRELRMDGETLSRSLHVDQLLKWFTDNDFDFYYAADVLAKPIFKDSRRHWPPFSFEAMQAIMVAYRDVAHRIPASAMKRDQEGLTLMLGEFVARFDDALLGAFFSSSLVEALMGPDGNPHFLGMLILGMGKKGYAKARLLAVGLSPVHLHGCHAPSVADVRRRLAQAGEKRMWELLHTIAQAHEDLERLLASQGPPRRHSQEAG